MAGSCSWASLIFCIVFFPVFAQPQPPSFIFNDFNGSESKLTLEGASIIRASGALKLTNKSNYAVGHAFYSESIQMLDNKSLPGSPKASSFSTTFVFAIVPPTSGRGGHGLAFTLSPSKQFPGAEAGHYMGIFNKENDGLSSNHVFAVEFDTVNGFNDDSDSDGNHVGININSMYSKETEPAAYFINNTNLKEDMKLESGDPVHAWIEYDGNFVNVTISPLKVEKPSQPLISHRIDLTPLVEETMYVGFSASTGEKSSSHFILGWSFSTGGTARQLNVSQLPVPPPKEKDGSSFDPQVIGLIAALSTVTVLLLGILIYFTLYKRKAKSEELEDWELDCPHRFQYKDLYAATRGFKDKCHKAGQILDAMDPKLNSSFVIEEVRLVLLLGLLCSHPKPEVRPSMRKVMRYLNRDDPLPPIDYWESFDSRDELYSKFLEVISSDYKITKSHPSSSTSTSISYSSGT
ncbi:hypothetical protein SCA6_001238 [Theobroma cacao]